jgi:hypothetical protein
MAGEMYSALSQFAWLLDPNVLHLIRSGEAGVPELQRTAQKGPREKKNMRQNDIYVCTYLN